MESGSENDNQMLDVDPKDFSITNTNYMMNCYRHYSELMHNLYGYKAGEEETATKPDEDLPLATSIIKKTEHVEKLNENVAAAEATTSRLTIDNGLAKEQAKEKTQVYGEKDRRFENPLKKFKQESLKDDASLKRPKEKPEPIKRDIPANQRHRLPRFYFLGPRRSQLTVKQHDIHVATMLNLAKVQKSIGFSLKDHEQRLKLLQVEHEIFNRLARENILQDKRKYLENFNLSYGDTVKTRNYFFAKLNKIQHIYPQKYTFSSDFDAANLAAMQNSPTLEYKKLLLETGKIPKVVMPNVEKRFLMADHQSYNPRELDLRESTSLKNDPNVPKLCEKYAPNFVMNFSAAKTLLSGNGPLNSNDWMLPVFVDSCFIQGRKTRIVYIMKPLPNTSLDAWQVLNHSFKRTLLNCLIDQPSAAGVSTSSGGGGRRQTMTSQDSAAVFDDTTAVDLDAAEKFTGDDWLRSQRVEKVDEKIVVENNINITPTLPKAPESVNNINIDQNSENDALKIVENDGIKEKPEPQHHYPQRACAAACTEKIRQFLFSPRRSAPLPPVAESSEKNASRPDIVSPFKPSRSVRLSKYVSNESEAVKSIADAPIDVEKSSVDDVLSKILDDGKKIVGDKSKILKNVQMKPKQHIVDPDVHINPNSTDLVGAQILKSDHFHRMEKLGSNTQRSIGEGMGRFHTILNELYALDNDGWYLLKPSLQNRDSIGIYQPVHDETGVGDSIIDLSKIYSRYSWLDNFKSSGDLNFDQICPPFDPKVVFQWNRILKRVPCALNPRKDNETPLLEPAQNPKETKGCKKKKKKSKSKETVKQNKKDDVGEDDDANFSSEIDH